jgi:hypothetical protein
MSEVGYQEALPNLIQKVLTAFNSCLAILDFFATVTLQSVVDEI